MIPSPVFDGSFKDSNKEQLNVIVKKIKEGNSDDSDTGSDVFMPDITKCLPQQKENFEENGSYDGSDVFMPDDVNNIKILGKLKDNESENKPCNTTLSTDAEKTCIYLTSENVNESGEEEKSLHADEGRVTSDIVQERTQLRKHSISGSLKKIDDENLEQEGDDDDDSLSGTLEINTEVTPDIGDKASKEELDEFVEDRNIFSSTDLFLHGADIKKEPEKDLGRSINQNDDQEDHGLADNPPYYENIEVNLYLIDKKKSRCNKQVRRMTCECSYEPDDPLFIGCDEDCLNRLLMIECSKSCRAGEFCTNRSFQKGCQYDLEIIKAGRKGWGVRTKEPISKGSFVIEYCGEVVDYDEFHNRTLQYDAEGMTHYYFMTLKTNEIIDATKKGCKSRFINHSCDPNCVTQKWTVNGFLRVGFFALRDIEAYEELCFDYQFQRFGEKPQDCYCGAATCRGVIGIESTNSIPSYIEKISKLSNSPSNKQKKRKKQMKEFYESELADELNDLLGSKWELKEGKQTLELLRLMVKVETLHERKELLKILQNAQDSAPLKAFVRYKGLSLLWSWMVDAPDDRPKYKVEILKTLKHIPIPNKNELDDSKLLSVIVKWATPLTECQSSQEDSSSTPSNKLDEDVSDGESPSDNENKNEEGNTSQDDSSKEDDSTENTKKISTLSSVEEGSLDEIPGKKSKKKDKATRKKERKESRKLVVPTLSSSLLDEWKELKEVFRIPKKSQTPDRRHKQENEESSSPLPDEKRSSVDSPSNEERTPANNSTVNTKKVAADSTFPSPPGRHRQLHPQKAAGTFNTIDDSNQSNQNKAIYDVGKNGYPNNVNAKREWRKSGSRGKRYNNRSGLMDKDIKSKNGNIADSSSWGSNDDLWSKGNVYRNRNNRDKGGNFDGGNWNTNNNWVKGSRQWNNRGINNHEVGSSSDDNIDGSILSWRKHQQGWNTHLMQQQQQSHFGSGVGLNLPLRANMPSMMGVGGAMSNARGLLYAGNLMSNPALPQPGMFQPPPMPPMLPTQLQQNSPLVSPMNPPPSSFGQVPLPPPSAPVVSSTQYTSPAPAQPDVTALNVVNQLQLLLNAERLKQAQDGSRQGTPDQNRNSTTTSPRPRTTSISPTRSKPVPGLPPHWKTATDSEGRMYYYHAITRETSWEPPVHTVDDDSETPHPPKKSRRQHSKDLSRSPTSYKSPPHRYSPRIAAADTTHHHGPRTPPGPKLSSSKQTASAEKQRIKEAFKTKMSSVVVNCLNVYQKVDCKQGRIKSSDDFKFLARKLTHGLILKEIQRIKDESLLSCNDSVKLKVKEYIRNYMRKFGAYYIRS